MIEFTDNRESIINLWQEAFCDSREEIEFFIDNVKNARCLMYFNGDIGASMMYLVDCKVNGEKLYYIYAACTLKDYEGRGYMTELIDFCLSHGMKVCLIPASESLVDFYSKRKICNRFDIGDIKFDEIPEIEEYLFEGYELKQPTALRS